MAERKTKNVIEWQKAWIPKGSYPTKEKAEARAMRLRHEGYKVHTTSMTSHLTGKISGYEVSIDGYIPVQSKKYVNANARRK